MIPFLWGGDLLETGSEWWTLSPLLLVAGIVIVWWVSGRD